ncbi:CheR family methyltransferase [Botrimarina hoheduenensis]|uniref:protein-glutamate O-methyltransferase n=1 Tax=Botrimarina hoheduenensis TaxID=2528000 RepID=A0A5C5WDT5_9BACT|nr:protein-glutamate O-methyltransferase CheR [Botrimarina hoheduenensis]TWT48261.1 Chemotaxis protein methyltransferase Cher2 [Botrimarina hoheduenensis]
MKPTAADIDAVCNLVNELCGIYLDTSKDYLIEGRLARLLKTHGCKDYVELSRKARLTPALQTDVVNAITTNETLWFRDTTPFEALKNKIFPELIDAKAGSAFPKRFRIWSAACSTGQEAYSLAMAFADTVPNFESWDLEIYGTDISPSAVQHAQQAVYSELELSRGLSQQHRGAYFVHKGNGWGVNDTLKRRCKFEVRNLLKPLTGVGKFDLIFCRNVAIYFTPADRKRLFIGLAETLNRGGWLFSGSGESLADLGPNWAPKQHCRAVCYQPNGCNGVATLLR